MKGDGLGYLQIEALLLKVRLAHNCWTTTTKEQSKHSAGMDRTGWTAAVDQDKQVTQFIRILHNFEYKTSPVGSEVFGVKLRHVSQFG